MLCCSHKSHSRAKNQEEISYLTKNTHFTPIELTELKTRFNRMAKNTNFITKIQFRDNLGLLGLGTMLYLSDRIFDIMDDDRDGKIRFQDFALYFDKVSFGDANDKAEISFKLIDKSKQGFFNFTEFNNTMQGIINSWITLTGQHITIDVKKQLDSHIKQIFDTMDAQKEDKVTLIQYQQSISKDPNLLEIFDFIKKGLQEINTDQQDRDELYQEKLQQMEKTLEELLEYMKKADGIELAELKLERFSSSFKKQITGDSHQQFGHFTENEEHFPQSSSLPVVQQRSMQMDQFHPSPIESILQFPNQSSHKVIMSNQLQKIEINYPTFQQAQSHESSQVIQSPNIPVSPFAEQSEKDNQHSCLTFSQKNIHNLVKVQFKQIKRVENNEDIPENDNNLSLISEQLSEDQEQLTQQRTAKNPLLRQSLQSQQQQDDFDQFLVKLTDKQMQQKYKNVIHAVKNLNDEIKLLKHMMEDDKFMKDKQELKFSNLETLRANTAAKVHKQQCREQKEKKKVQKKPKISVSFGHENFNLVLNMMMGIQMAVNSINMSDDYEISQDDYKLKYYFELLPRRAQSDKATVKVCQFFDYAPRVFNSIRIIHKIDNQAYLKSIGPETLLQSLLKGDLSTLQELTSTGKSGSFFYYTADGKFTLKTVHHQEFRFLKKILQPYYEHIKANQDSLIIKFFGMHKIGIKYSTLKKEKVIYFVIMSNIFSTSKEINQRYDLKGSRYKRITFEEDPTIAMKDLNFINNKVVFKLEPAKKNAFITQLEKDCQFFAQNNIIDYSLLVGIHKKNKMDNDSSVFSEQTYYDTIQVLSSTDKQEIYYFGIIDILTDFSTKKKLEYLSKRVVYGPSISAIPPNDYSQRFYRFIYESIMKTQNE